MMTPNPRFDDTLSHIVYDVLCMPRGGMFERAVKTFSPGGEGSSSINSVNLTHMDPTEKDDLHYVDDNGVTIPLSRPLRDLVLVLGSYMEHHMDFGKHPEKFCPRKWWAIVTARKFDRYQQDATLVGSVFSKTCPSHITLGFKDGVTCDPMAFPLLESIEQLDDWLLTFMEQTWAQDVAENLDASYTPRVQYEKELFEKNQNLLFDALTHSLQNYERGVHILSVYSRCQDARAVNQCFVEHSRTQLAAKPYKEFIQYARIDDRSWQNTVKYFIVYWKYQSH